MRNILFALSVLFSPFYAHAGDSIFGKWIDKSHPNKYRYEFIKGHDFIFTHNWKAQGQSKSSTSLDSHGGL
jgi:hypothetical protein